MFTKHCGSRHSLSRTCRPWLALALAGLAALAALAGAGPAEAALQTDHKVIGYVPNWLGNVNFVRYDKLTHINYAFLVPREDGSLQTDYYGDLLQTVVTNAHANGVKVLISVGGGAGSNGMGRAICNTAYPSSAATLKANLLSFMSTYSLDGIDLDWEYPQSAAEAACFTSFVTDLAVSVHAQGKLLTAATVGANWVGQYYSDQVVDAFDFMNVMAYDIAGENHSSYEIALSQLSYWADRGVPASKLVLGVPFYGYPSPEFNWAALAYKDILAADPSAYTKDFAAGYAYNGVPTMIAKTELAMTSADGIMIWQLAMDTTPGPASLLDAIANTIGSGPVTTYTISASAGAGGSISPSGSVSVVSGTSRTFTITPNSGYNVSQVLVDGVNQGALTSYTFTNVTANHSISASFNAIPVGGDLARGKTTTASSVETSAFPASYATDGNAGTRWSSQYVDPSWIQVDLGSALAFNRVVLSWEAAYGRSYQIQVSSNGSTWTPVYTQNAGTGGLETLDFAGTTARYVRLYGTARGTQWGYSLWSFEVYNTSTVQYAITASAGSGGSISPSGTVSVNAGASQSFTISPNAGYNVSQVLVDGVNQGALTSYTFANVAANHSISASFSVIPVTTYTISASAGSGGSISPSGSVSVTAGASRSFTITPNSGYNVSQVLVDGVNQGALTSYTFANVTANHSISASFSATPVGGDLARGKTTTASSVETSALPASNATDGNAGTRWSSQFVDPSWIRVDLGSALTFNRVVLSWEAAYGRSYQIQVSSNGSSWSTVYTQSAGSGGLETLNFASTTARYVRMYGTARGTQWGYSLWSFEVYNTSTVQYAITASAGAGGSISPAGSVSVAAGASRSFTITPNSGYNVSQVLVDGVNQGALTSYTFTNVTANHSISASFSVIPVTTYTITASAGSGGSISPSGSVGVTAGASRSFTITPNSGYNVSQVLVDGVNQGALSSYTFTNVTANHSISASFASSTGKATGPPGNPHLSHNNWTGESSYALHMTMWYGNNGSSWEVYENGVRIHAAALVDNSPYQQDAEYVVAGKANGTYSYSCRLINSYGTNTSDPISVTVTKGGAGDTTPPSTPSGLHTTNTTATSIALAWAASTDNVAVAGYDVSYGGSTVSVTATSATISGLTPDTTYTFTVRARDAAGNVSAATPGLTVATSPDEPDTEAPSAPQNLAVSGKTASSVSLAWTASNDDVGVVGYDVSHDGSTTSVASNSATITGLSASTSYTFRVVARDAAGNVSGAATITVTTSEAGPIVEPDEMLFDDFSYGSPDDPAFLDNWKASDYSPAAPGLGSFSKDNVVFLADPANGSNTLMQIRFTTQGSRETTVQGEVEGQRRFLYGTYASRMRFYNQPVQGPAQVIGPDTGDHMVATFFTISPYYVPNTEYGELDFEYLPNAGWNGDGPRFTSSTMWNTTWETRDVRLANANQLDCSGWHTFWMTVTPAAVKYYMDDVLLTTHSNTEYLPETEMLIMYNLWLTGEQFALGQSGTSRTWAEDVDWVYHGKDVEMSRAQIEEAVAYYRDHSVDKVDTMPPPIEAP